MKSANAPFNEFGQSMILRDIEDLYIDVDKINASLFGLQTGTTSLSQQVLKNASSIGALQTNQTIDEAAIAVLQTSVAALFQPTTCGGYDSAGATASPGFSVTANPFTTYTAFANATLAGFNATTGVWTCPTTGWYMFVVNVRADVGGIANSDPVTFSVTVNNVDGGGSQPPSYIVTRLFAASISDTATLQAPITRVAYITASTAVSVSASLSEPNWQRTLGVTCTAFNIVRLS